MNGKRRLLCYLTAMLMISVACGKKNPPKNMKTLVWYYVNDRGSDDGSVFGAANKIIGEKLGVQVDFNPIHSEEYTKKIQLKASAAERFDIVFTSDWLFDYRSNIEYGAFAPIENLIEKYATVLDLDNLPEPPYSFGDKETVNNLEHPEESIENIETA